jgi:hypothetical protein
MAIESPWACAAEDVALLERLVVTLVTEVTAHHGAAGTQIKA